MKCLICNGLAESIVTQGPYNYYECTSCHTAQLLPQPSKQEITEFYQKYHLSAEEGGIYGRFEDRTKADFGAKCEYIKKHAWTTQRTPCLLDVGCGKGFFVKKALSCGFAAEGIDLSPSAVEYGRRELGVVLHEGRVEVFQEHVGEGRYDIVTCWATIEHLPDPTGTVRAIYTLLKPGGRFFLDTGCNNTFWERFLAGHSQWYDAPQHLFVFSLKGIGILLEQSNFSLCSVDSNWERNLPRRLAKAFRNNMLALGTYALSRPMLGPEGFKAVKREAKWPLGNLLSLVAAKSGNCQS